MKIIFLDIDGVLNCETGYKDGFCNYDKGDKKMHDLGQSFYPPSMDLLNKLIEETDAKIVISSTWRKSGLEHMRNVWKHRKMSGEIIDITPNFSGIVIGDLRMGMPRGLEIQYWLKEKGFANINWSKDYQEEYIEKSGIENYIIIDDDSDMTYKQRKHFVHVLPSPRNKLGFNKSNYNKAKRILKGTVIDVNY